MNIHDFKIVSLIFILSTTLVLNGTNFFSAHSAPIVFPFGVESGDPTSDSAVLWTKVNGDASVEVEVSTSETFDPLVFKRTLPATSANDYTLKTTATGLAAGTDYFYRWREGTTYSETGHFRTAPSNTQPSNVRFSWSGDSDPSMTAAKKPYFGPWDVLGRMFSENNDFFIYLGDVIYSDLRGNTGKKTSFDDAKTLPEFRQLYKDQKTLMNYPNLNRIPFYVLWDDHEVKNDWAGQTVDKSRYNIGKKSFSEYMPIKEEWAASDPYCAGPTQYRTIHWGSLVDIIILDTRTCRSDSAEVKKACTDDKGRTDLAPTLPKDIRVKYFKGVLSTEPPAKCLEAIRDPHRTMLGAKQKEMFEKDLLNANVKFKFVISSVNIQQTFAFPYDSWEGYQAERNEILRYIDDNKIKNVIFLSTDSHLNLYNEVYIDFFTKPATPIAYEFVAGPIAAITDGENLKAKSGDGKAYVLAKQFILTQVGADCRNLNIRSFGTVTLNQPTGTLEITLKDKDGNVVKDEIKPSISCTKTFKLS